MSFLLLVFSDIITLAIAMNVCEPGQDRNVAALSIMFMCGGFLNYMEKYETYMLEALKEAKLAALEDEVPIGCVIVKDDQIIARAHNQREVTNNPLGHAETLAIKKASEVLDDWQLVDTELYVTIEPCLMCAGAIIQSRIRKVVYGAPDFKGGAFGSSLNVMDAKDINHRPEVVSGVLEKECTEIIQNYFKSKRK